MSEDKKVYVVKKPIAYLGSRFETGAEIPMTAAEAENIGEEYVELKEGQASSQEASSENTAGVSGNEGSGSQTDKPAGEGSEGSQVAGSEAGSENSQT